MHRYAWAVHKRLADSNRSTCCQSWDATREGHHTVAMFQLVTAGRSSTREEPIPVYDNPKATATQPYSLPKAQFLQHGRLIMLVAGFDDDTNAHRSDPERRGKQFLDVRDTVEVIGWVCIVTKNNRQIPKAV